MSNTLDHDAPAGSRVEQGRTCIRLESLWSSMYSRSHNLSIPYFTVLSYEYRVLSTDYTYSSTRSREIINTTTGRELSDGVDQSRDILSLSLL